GASPFTESQEDEYFKKINKWSLVRDTEHKLRKIFNFKDFKEALSFVNKVGEIAEQDQHHPDIKVVYNKVQIELFTHAVGGLSENDFIVAAKIDSIK
ncbi:MAG: 4a-hydroxytetrahydrobiopterin dehydratase, partial [Candidatus Levyibacteriota bacterium]